MAKANLTAEVLRTLVQYNQETGIFTRPNGRRAGCAHGNGYREIYISGIRFYEHRIAWLYVTGSHPTKYIDHINGDKSDNRFCNLRDVSHSTNLQNIKTARSDSKSGMMGVSWSKAAKKWTARITVNGKYKHLGLFDTPEEAFSAYLGAKRVHHKGCTI